ncbi:DUF4344 domain-containing metallopeptidase [Vibrio cyclitrophicus]|uniref:DUF4344 domain-containing metallopeptidase n=1 Tax=Vibrio cyclitrophicus TaxID=47951 RepID=UPI000C848C42|nr:DUF4344 domain-containing metallopeptidase [Vibrio cyclitrophicus]PMH23939.1 hypothetical protein BCU73_08675 [Vibrio cyclitrophicus]PMH76100.1 hypothetical protein BCU59_14675 [Vibrio cyclitrophicus]PMI46706.1 hypothetical protein BCU44_06895 [Vibrio cyclitrophicus]
MTFIKLVQKRALTYSLAIGSVFATTYVSSETSRVNTLPDNLIVEYSTPKTEAEQQIKKEIQLSGVNDTVIDLSNQLFMFNNPLTIQYGNEDGPLYDPQTHQVLIPYSFYAESLTYFEKNQYEKEYGKTAQTGAIDTLLHTLLHEAGHAYIEDQKIAILGKEEDAVDNLATIMLLNYVEHGGDTAISAADMFAFESEDRPEYYDLGEYIDEHSFDLQRYFSTLCLVYGSDPEAYKNLLDDVENDYLKNRKEFCVEHFDVINANWHQYLKESSEG